MDVGVISSQRASSPALPRRLPQRPHRAHFLPARRARPLQQVGRPLADLFGARERPLAIRVQQAQQPSTRSPPRRPCSVRRPTCRRSCRTRRQRSSRERHLLLSAVREGWSRIGVWRERRPGHYYYQPPLAKGVAGQGSRYWCCCWDRRKAAVWLASRKAPRGGTRSQTGGHGCEGDDGSQKLRPTPVRAQRERFLPKLTSPSRRRLLLERGFPGSGSMSPCRLASSLRARAKLEATTVRRRLTSRRPRDDDARATKCRA